MIYHHVTTMATHATFIVLSNQISYSYSIDLDRYNRWIKEGGGSINYEYEYKSRED